MGSPLQIVAKLALTIFVLFLVTETEGAYDPVQVTESRFTSPEFGRDTFWGLTDANKTRTCILLSGRFEIAIPYDTDYFSSAIALIPVPKRASVNGYCDSDTNPNVQALTLAWSPDSERPEVKHSLTFTFRRKSYSLGEDEESKASLPEPYYALVSIRGVFYTNDVQFPDAFFQDRIYTLTASNLREMSAPESLSYFCQSPQSISFDDDATSIGMSFVHAEAFHGHIALGDGKDFGPKSFCTTDGLHVILTVLTYIMILALIGLAVFYLMDKRKKRSYIYL